MQNPYTNRNTIRDPAMFFGRTDYLARIYALLANTQSVSIIGDRRIGKSSLLYNLAQPEVQARIGRYDFTNYQFVYIDLQGGVYQSAAEFLNYLWRKLCLRAETWRPPPAGEMASHEAFETAVASANEQGFKLVFLLDEFDYVIRSDHLDAPLFSFLRYLANNYDLSIVTASQRPLAELCHTNIVDSPFFNIFAMEPLDALTSSEALDLITLPSTKAGCALAGEAPWVLEMTGRQPMFIQIACFHLFEMQARPSGPVEVDQAAVQARFYEEVKPHFEYAWDHLVEEERRRLQKEIWQERALARHYLAESSAFHRFVRALSGHQTSQEALITGEELKETLKNFWKVADLGQAPLTKLNLVKQYLIQHELPSIGPNQGRALQDVLKTAIEHLWTAHRKAETHLEWDYGFILQQCYVEGAPNKDIAIQLNVSERQFYRLRDGAVEALVGVLREMEQRATSV